MSVHHSILELSEQLGYLRSEGYCLGFALRWLEAWILNEKSVFQRRVELITKTDSKYLVELIQKARKKEKGQLTPEDEELLEIPAFFDSLNLYQDPENYPLLFPGVSLVSQQSVGLISPLAAADKIQVLGGLTSRYSEALMGTEEQITRYFEELGAILDERGVLSQEPFAMLLSNRNHAVGLIYKPGGKWEFMDINQYPERKFTFTTLSHMVRYIKKGFSDLRNPYTVFNMELFTTGKAPFSPSLQNLLQVFKERHEITAELAKNHSQQANLVYIAGRYGHSDVIEKLAEKGVDLNTRDLNGSTAAYSAAYFGHIDVIRELAKHAEVDFNIPDINGCTPIFAAAHQGQVELIAELAKSPRVNFNSPDQNGYTPAYAAAENGHYKAIVELAKSGANLDTINQKGASPVFIAAQEGHYLAVNELLKWGADMTVVFKLSVAEMKQFSQAQTPQVEARINVFLKPYLDEQTTISLSPYTIAELMGHPSIQQLLRKHEAELKKNEILLKHIKELKTHCDLLPDAYYPAEHERLVDELECLAKAFITAKETPKTRSGLRSIQEDFKKKLNEANDAMQGHRAYWKPILANIAIAATGIGLLAIIVHYVRNGSVFFMQTKRQQLITQLDKDIAVTEGSQLLLSSI